MPPTSVKGCILQSTQVHFWAIVLHDRHIVSFDYVLSAVINPKAPPHFELLQCDIRQTMIYYLKPRRL